MTFSDAIIGKYYRVKCKWPVYKAIVRVDELVNPNPAKKEGPGFKGPRLILVAGGTNDLPLFNPNDGMPKCINGQMQFELYPATYDEIKHLDACIGAGKIVDMPEPSTINTNYSIF